jgi:hypothetical protein
VGRLRRSLALLAHDTPEAFTGVALPTSDVEMEALVAPAVALALAACATRQIRGPSDGTCVRAYRRVP